MGVPLLDIDGQVLGHLAVFDTRPMPEEPRAQTLFRIFAARAAAELQRLRAETEVRERGNDIILLASAFAEKFAHKMGRRIEPLTQEDTRHLKSYNWPGNVRELQNVIERAVITSQGGRLNLNRALPETAKDTLAKMTAPAEETSERIRTIGELEGLERQNLIRALETTGWRVSGENGAARLLGINSSTLSSRMKALGIKRPR